MGVVQRVGERREIRTLDPRDAMGALIPHWYGARFGEELLRSLGLATHFEQCADLARNVPVRVLERTDSLEALPDVARLVERDITRDSVPAAV